MYSFAGNRVVRDTGADYPIFQAPIGLISRSALVGSVSAAGGVGLMETMFLPSPTCRRNSIWCELAQISHSVCIC